MLLVEYITGITFNSLLFVLGMTELMLMTEYITDITFMSILLVPVMTQLMPLD